MKVCIKCGMEKPGSEFYRNRGMADGLIGKCRTCCAAYTRDYYRQHVEEVKTKNRIHKRTPKALAARRAYSKTPAGRAAAAKAKLNNEKRYRERHLARKTLRRAVSKGTIKKEPCAICGSDKSQAHHPDYSKPLDVIWLCDPHHKAEHRRIKGFE